MNKLAIKIVFSLPLIMLSAVLFWLSSMPDLTPPDLGFNFQDKLYHAAAYFVYGSSALLAVMTWYPNASSKMLRVTAVIVAAGFALSDEVHQYFVPTRHASIDDWFADVIGIVCSLLLLTFFRKFLVRFG